MEKVISAKDRIFLAKCNFEFSGFKSDKYLRDLKPVSFEILDILFPVLINKNVIVK